MIEVLQWFLINQKMLVPQRHLEKKKMKQLSFWPSPFVHALVLAPVAAILRRSTLITILSVSKRNGPQRPPSHIKPIMFGNELRNYDMIPKEGQSLNSYKQYFILTGMTFLLLQLAISLWQVICKTHGFSLSRIVCKRKKNRHNTKLVVAFYSPQLLPKWPTKQWTPKFASTVVQLWTAISLASMFGR